MVKEGIKKVYFTGKSWYEKYECWLIPSALVFGVIVDFFTFSNIQINTAFLILVIHIVSVGLAIAYTNAYEIKKIKEGKITSLIKVFGSLIIQFSFGALLSASFIFYFFSGSIFVSWPFILLIIILMISNEIFREYYLRIGVQLSVYYFLLFSIFAIILPFILQKIGILIFVISGLLSTFFIILYISLLAHYIDKEKFNIKFLIKPIITIFIFINILYFLNVIPPIPLSLKDAVIGHSIKKVNNDYYILVEEESIFDKFLPSKVVYKIPSEYIVLYTAIFAPGTLKTDIFHNWQYRENNKWVSKDRFSYNIVGGREAGYRGYSLKSNLLPGKWRVDIETDRGQVLGRVEFKIVGAKETPALVEIIK